MSGGLSTTRGDIQITPTPHADIAVCFYGLCALLVINIGKNFISFLFFLLNFYFLLTSVVNVMRKMSIISSSNSLLLVNRKTHTHPIPPLYRVSPTRGPHDAAWLPVTSNTQSSFSDTHSSFSLLLLVTFPWFPVTSSQPFLTPPYPSPLTNPVATSIFLVGFSWSCSPLSNPVATSILSCSSPLVHVQDYSPNPLTLLSFSLALINVDVNSSMLLTDPVMIFLVVVNMSK